MYEATELGGQDLGERYQRRTYHYGQYIIFHGADHMDECQFVGCNIYLMNKVKINDCTFTTCNITYLDDMGPLYDLVGDRNVYQGCQFIEKNIKEFI